MTQGRAVVTRIQWVWGQDPRVSFVHHTLYTATVGFYTPYTVQLQCSIHYGRGFYTPPRQFSSSRCKVWEGAKSRHSFQKQWVSINAVMGQKSQENACADFFLKPLDSEHLSGHALSESKEDSAIFHMKYAMSVSKIPTVAADTRDSPNLQTLKKYRLECM